MRKRKAADDVLLGRPQLLVRRPARHEILERVTHDVERLVSLFLVRLQADLKRALERSGLKTAVDAVGEAALARALPRSTARRSHHRPGCNCPPTAGNTRDRHACMPGAPIRIWLCVAGCVTPLLACLGRAASRAEAVRLRRRVRQTVGELARDRVGALARDITDDRHDRVGARCRCAR